MKKCLNTRNEMHKLVDRGHLEEISQKEVESLKGEIYSRCLKNTMLEAQIQGVIRD